MGIPQAAGMITTTGAKLKKDDDSGKGKMSKMAMELAAKKKPKAKAEAKKPEAIKVLKQAEPKYKKKEPKKSSVGSY